MPDSADVLGLARLVPLALGVAAGTIVTGVVVTPGLRSVDTATGLYVIDEEEPTRPDLSAVLEGLSPSTAPAPTVSPVADLGSTLVDLSSRGFTVLPAESPFDGPLDVAEAASFADVDVAAYQQELERRELVEGPRPCCGPMPAAGSPL